MQYIFQCACPTASDEARYPERVDVVIPACRHNAIRLSPSGRMLYVATRVLWNDADYLLDLQTGERTPVSIERSTAQVFGKPAPPKGSVHFLNDALIFHTFYGIDEYILDRMNGVKYPIQAAQQLQPSIYSMGNVDPNLLLNALLQVDQIFLIDEAFQPVIALSLDFRTHPESTFIFNALDFPGDEPNRVEQFLKGNKIAYHYIPGIFTDKALSPDGKLIAREDGIYLVETDQKIVNGYPGIEPFDPSRGKYFALRGWVYDSTGALYSSSRGLCLMQIFFMNETECIIKVPQPVLKLKVPQEYLLPTSP